MSLARDRMDAFLMLLAIPVLLPIYAVAFVVSTCVEVARGGWARGRAP